MNKARTTRCDSTRQSAERVRHAHLRTIAVSDSHPNILGGRRGVGKACHGGPQSLHLLLEDIVTRKCVGVAGKVLTECAEGNSRRGVHLRADDGADERGLLSVKYITGERVRVKL